MAEVTFQSFVSCSFQPEDRKLVEFFLRLLRAFRLEPFVYDYQEIGRLSDKVKEHIISRDCLVAIATRRQKIEGSPFWACPDWIQHEVALACAYKKPIAILVEEGVRLEGLIAQEERREVFSREGLIDNIDRITSFLFSMRQNLDHNFQMSQMHIPVLLRHSFHIKEEIRSRQESVLRGEVYMECLADRLEATHHSNDPEDTSQNVSVRSKSFSFLCKEKPDRVSVRADQIIDTDSRNLWNVVFDPPLRKGDKVRYAFKQITSCYRPFTREELEQRISNKTYRYPHPACVASEWNIAYPTAEFSFQIDFPENYDLEKHFLDVRMGEADLKADTEYQRIIQANMFSAEKIIDRWTLALRIPKPLQDHTYYIYYMPPREADLILD